MEKPRNKIRRARKGLLPGALFILTVLGVALWNQSVEARFQAGQAMPEFTTADPARWLNSKPLTKADLAGKVVLVEVWTSI